MRIGRTLPPAGAPIYPEDIISGLKGIFGGRLELKRFESELREYFGVKHCFLVSSGRAALTLILQALKDIHPDRDEVLIPAYTCYTVPSAIVKAGLKVRLCDIDPKTLDFDFDELSKILNPPGKPETYKSKIKNQKSKIKNRLLAIIPVHLFGLPSDIDRLRSLVGSSEVTIIEDAAQSMGGEWDGRKLGSNGDVSFFSLGRGKTISTVEGGIILTNDRLIAEKITKQIEELPDYGCIGLIKLFFYSIILTLFLHPLLFWIPKGIPFLRLGETIYDPKFKAKKMSSFQAGLRGDWQNKLKKFKKSRLVYTKQWTKNLYTVKCENYLSGTITHNPQLATPGPDLAYPHNANETVSDDVPEFMSDSLHGRTRAGRNPRFPDLIRFPVMIRDDVLRRRILEESERYGLGIMPGYPDSINGIHELKNDFVGEEFPVAKEVAKKLITLPIHPFVNSNDGKRISALFSPFFTKNGLLHKNI